MYEFLNKYKIIGIVSGVVMIINFHNHANSPSEILRQWSIILGAFLIFYAEQLITERVKGEDEFSITVLVILSCVYVVLLKVLPIALHVIGASSLLIIYLLMRANYKLKWTMLITTIGIGLIAIVKI